MLVERRCSRTELVPAAVPAVRNRDRVGEKRRDGEKRGASAESLGTASYQTLNGGAG
jgi:hypothetical protein